MLNLLWLAPALPLAGALILATVGSRLPRRVVASIGAGSIGLAFIVAALVGWSFLSSPPPGNFFLLPLWTWITAGTFQTSFGLYLDPVSLLMLLVITFVGFLIHLYSTEYMAGDQGYARFFAYMNLFVVSMIMLVLGSNLLVLYLGWEGVGLCSYLLIGFWYHDPANVRAANKAFLTTRIGDTAFAIGLFLLFAKFGTLDIQQLMNSAKAQWAAGSFWPTLAAALLLGGAVGKSAQLPLQTWLPDAMAGPTPTSALIHAATMVTAGVYLIARTNVLFTLAPEVQLAVAVIGGATLLMAACSALVQRDIKRVLAYSTISQIGYMFLALGLGAWSAAMFHFMTHAFFKALLFLAAGAVITALHHEQDMFRMGGLRRELPVAFWSFVIGGSALAGLPLLTSGFFSKDLILWQSWAGPNGNIWFWLCGFAGALLTSLYTYRLIFLVFYGSAKTHVAHKPGLAMNLPLLVLCVLSLVGGFVDTPPHFGGVPALSNFLNSALPALEEVHVGPITEEITALVASVVFAAGFGLAFMLYYRRTVAQPSSALLARFWLAGWGFDALYGALFIKPYIWLANVNRNDLVDAIYNGLATFTNACHAALRTTETGRIRWYASGLALGSAVLVAIVWLAGS
jgi:NADH-quinone oxidoreductase subunit L